MKNRGNDPEQPANLEESMALIGRNIKGRAEYLDIDRDTIAHELRARYGLRSSKPSVNRIMIGTQNINLKTLLGLADLLGSDLGIRRWFIRNEQYSMQFLLDDEKFSRELQDKLSFGYSPDELIKALTRALRDMP